jgi:hypothetical protein
VSTDVDWFKGIALGNQFATITMTPVGRNESLNQQGEDTCVAAPASMNSRNVGDLWVEVRAGDGTSILAQRYSAGLGGTETITGLLLTGGDFYVRVLPLGAFNGNQAYNLTVRGDSQPTLAASDNAFASTIRLTWSEVATANDFRIYRNTTNNRGTAALRATVDGALEQYDDNSVVSGTTYYYWIEAEQNFSGFLPMAGPATGQAGLIPSNNNCANAATLNVGVVLSGSTTLATNDGSATCGTSATSKDVWYNFTAPCTGTARISTCGTHDTGGTDLGMDTVVSVYSGCPGTNANQIACNDDAVGGVCSGSDTGTIRDSAVQFSAVAGTTYKVRVAGFNNTAGNFMVSASYLPPANDLCATAISINDGQQPYGTCGAATDGPAEPIVGNFFGYNQVGADVWFRYTPSCTGIATIDLCNSAYDCKVAVYDGSCPANPGTAIACNDDSAQCGSTRSYLQFDSSHQQQYLIRIGGYQSATGSGVMTIGCQGGCGSQDFNGDGDFGTDQDIEAFFRVLGGGTC